MAIASKVADSLGATALFADCGGDTPLTLPVPYVLEPSWERALTSSQQESWEYIGMEMTSLLREWLVVNSPSDRKRWNPLVELCKAEFDSAVGAKVREYMNSHKLPVFVLHRIQWHLVLALIEARLALPNMPTAASDLLLPVYLAGHYPCGWSGGEYPKGVLHIF